MNNIIHIIQFSHKIDIILIYNQFILDIDLTSTVLEQIQPIGGRVGI